MAATSSSSSDVLIIADDSSRSSDGPSSRSASTVSLGGESAGSTAVPTGNALYAKLAALVSSQAPDALEELKALAKKVEERKSTPLSELWDEGDEILEAGAAPRTSLTKFSPGASRIMQLETLPEKRREKAPPAAPQLRREQKEAAAAAAQAKKEPTVIDLSDDDAPRGSASSSSTAPSKADPKSLCHRCHESTSTTANPLLECKSCENFFHATCHYPEIPSTDHSDSSFIFVCAMCMSVKRPRAEGSASPRQKVAPAKKKKEVQQTALATFEAFKKKKEKQLSKEQLIRRK